MSKKVLFLPSILFLVSTFSACSQSPINSNPSDLDTKKISFSLARRVIPKKTSSSDLKKILGEPELVQSTGADTQHEVWIYLRSTQPLTRRMYAFVNPKSETVESVTWNVFEQEPEAKLDYLKKELGNPILDKIEPEWIKGDAHPDELYYKNEPQHLTITVRKTLNIVDRISWH